MGNLKKAGAGRNIGADIIRCLAFMSVVCVHFFVRTGYYDHTFVGEKMFLMTFVRSFFIICVPLYMTLSGYLSRNSLMAFDCFLSFLRSFSCLHMNPFKI